MSPNTSASPDPDQPARNVLLAFAASFAAQKNLADRATAQLTIDQLHQRIDPSGNSVATILKHVAGNLASRFTDFLTTDGEKPWRDRDAEFIDDLTDRAAILSRWEHGWSILHASLGALRPGDLSRTITIRGEPHTVPLALARSLAHVGYHAGQIVLTARTLAGPAWTTLTVPRAGSNQFNQQMGYNPATRPNAKP